MQTKFRERRKNKGLQPGRSFDHRTGYNKSGGFSGPERLDVVMPLIRADKTKAGAYRFKPLSEKEQKEFSQREKEVRTYQKGRQSRETQRRNRLEEKASVTPKPNKEIFPRSPIMDRPNKRADRRKAPPAQYKTPKPNPDIEPLQRKDDLSRSWNESQKLKDRGQNPEVRRQRSMDKIQESGNKGGRWEDRMQKFNDRQQRGDAGRQRLIER